MPTNQNSAQAVLDGANAFRLKQEVGSSGDIWEIDSSAAAIYVGPDSDLTEYRVTYYDPTAPNQLRTADFSVGGPLATDTRALLSQRVQSTGEPARILVNPVDLFEPDYVRPINGVPSAPSRTIIIPPVADVMFAFTPRLPGLPAVRSDRTVRLVEIPFEDDGVGTDVLIPAYGRRMITVQALSLDAVTLSFYKLVFELGNLPTAAEPINESITTGGVILPTLRSKVIRASNDVNNYFDSITPTTFEKQPTPGPIGTFDYLICNVQRGPVGAGPGVCRQLYFKLTDREV